ncbi:MAG TPA: dienelactone hydrolase family protein [Gemmatimonadaceae bacterium]|nr:dienelactone hydrolase family protein [Gemmatimonadaceae bacterium]
MARTRALLLALALAGAPATRVEAQASAAPDTVVVRSGALTLRALLWRPDRGGPFPAVLFNHGSGHGIRAPSGDHDEHPMEWQAARLGPVFARHGYVFLYLFRRGTGLSADQGTNSSDRWERERAVHGGEARDRLQLETLKTVELDDAFAGLTFLRAVPGVDARRIAVVGHSFGGSLTLLMAERDSTLRAAVVFAGAARSWPRSPALRGRLLAAAAHTSVPVFYVFAANDYSIAPARELSAEMARRGKPHRLMIYPPVGHTAAEGHGFVHLRIATWEPDVFAFLDEHVRP